MNWENIIKPENPVSREAQLRDDFERDHDRIIFSSAFRQLNQKTQVFPMPENYFVHNRMTHSIETSCIGRSLGKIIAKFIAEEYKMQDQYLFVEQIGRIIETACLAHDIGNPPFGHSGEDAISHYFIRNDSLIKKFTDKQILDLKNFEGNAQGFRLLTQTGTDIELTSNVIVVFTKYPKEAKIDQYYDSSDASRSDQKKYGFFQNEKDRFHKIAQHFELKKLSEKEVAYSRHPLAYIVEAADDICYLTIDIEDGVRLGIVPIQEVEEILIPIIKRKCKETDFESKYKLLQDNNDKMSYMRAKSINSLCEMVQEVYKDKFTDIENGKFNISLIDCIDGVEYVGKLKECTKSRLYSYRPVLEIEAAGFDIVSGLIDIIFDIKKDPTSKRNIKIAKLFPQELTSTDLSYPAILKVTDYISGMTDGFAINLYNKIKGVKLSKIY